jgi:NAD+ synthase (glutamine-hydrolysing)
MTTIVQNLYKRILLTIFTGCASKNHMKIALAQINPQIGDFVGNMRKIEEALEKAEERGSKLAVFPEMALTGYPPKDLLGQNRFVGENLKCLDRLARKTKKVAAIIGYVRPNPKPEGKPLQNAAALIADGEIVSTHAKTLLPSYEEFDELSYFEPADTVSIVDYCGFKLGISICEDICNPSDFRVPRALSNDPVTELVELGAEVIINISASPFSLGMRNERAQKLKEVAMKHSRPVVFVNQVGGNDELVFDGHSLAIDPGGKLIGRCREFAEDLIVVDIETGKGEVRDIAPNDEAAALDALTLGVRDYAVKCGFKSAVLGLSGGIDSSMVATIATRALGPENVLGVAMPSMYSSSASLADAESLVNNLGINFQVLEIKSLFEAFTAALATVFKGLSSDVTEENLQARVRAVLLMALSNKFGHLLLSTGNRSEAATGYATLYGDMAGGLSVLADIPKTLVYRLADEVNREASVIPRSIIDKAPSAELKPGQKDEDSLPSYQILDPILERLLDQRLGTDTVVAEGFDEKTVREVARLIRTSEYKRRQAPPGLKIISAGYALHIPIAQKWHW